MYDRLLPETTAGPDLSLAVLAASMADCTRRRNSAAPSIFVNSRLKRKANFTMIGQKRHRRMNLKLHKPRNGSVKASPNAQRSAAELQLKAIRKLANRVHRGSCRFAFYEYLTAVYRLNRLWRRSSQDRVTARRVARQLGLHRRKGSSPLRVIVDATNAAAGSKQKSRWVRALEFAAKENTPSAGLSDLFRSKGGVAGCARQAARLAPKKTITRDDWTPRSRKPFVDAAPKRRSDKTASTMRAKEKFARMDWFDPN
jgi:hypothetical protein